MNLKTIIANTLKILGGAVTGILDKVDEATMGTCARSGSCVDYNPSLDVCTIKKVREGYSHRDTLRCYKPRNPAEQKTQES